MPLRFSFLNFTFTCWLFLLITIAFSCSRKKEQLILETVEKRVADFTKKEKIKCREELLAEAEHIVDSLLLTEALSEVQDSLKQLRPAKPLPPDTILPIDSLKIKPIFEDQ